MKQDVPLNSAHYHHQATSEPQYVSSPVLGDRAADDVTSDSQTFHSEVRVAPDSIKEGWLNCKISNIDGKVSFNPSHFEIKGRFIVFGQLKQFPFVLLFRNLSIAHGNTIIRSSKVQLFICTKTKEALLR